MPRDCTCVGTCGLLDPGARLGANWRCAMGRANNPEDRTPENPPDNRRRSPVAGSTPEPQKKPEGGGELAGVFADFARIFGGAP